MNMQSLKKCFIMSAKKIKKEYLPQIRSFGFFGDSKLKNVFNVLKPKIKHTATICDKYYNKLPLDKINQKLGSRLDVKSSRFKRALSIVTGILFFLLFLAFFKSASYDTNYQKIIDLIPECSCSINQIVNKYSGHIDNLYETDLGNCAGNGDMESVKHIVKKFKLEKGHGALNSGVEAAINNDHLDVAEYLLNAGADPSARDWDSMLDIAINSNCKRVKFILEHSHYIKHKFTDDVSYGSSMIYDILQDTSAKPCVINELLTHGASVESDSMSPILCTIIMQGATENVDDDLQPHVLKLLDILLRNGADPNNKGPQGRGLMNPNAKRETPVEYILKTTSVLPNGTLWLAFLRDHGAKITVSVTAQNVEHKTREEYIVKNTDPFLKDYPKVRQELLDGLLIKYCTYVNDEPWFYEPQKQNSSLDPNIVSVNNPRMKAMLPNFIAQKENLEKSPAERQLVIIEILLKAGANPNVIVDQKENKTLLLKLLEQKEGFRGEKMSRIVNLLQKNGGDPNYLSTKSTK